MTTTAACRRGRGFTLVELMVVVLVLAVLTGALIPEMMGTYEDALLRGTGRKLADAIGLASSQAVATGKTYRLRLLADKGLYRIETLVEGSREGPRFAPAEGLPSAEGAIDRRIAVEMQPGAAAAPGEEAPDDRSSGDSSGEAGPGAIELRPDGTAGGAVIVLRDPNGFRLALRVLPATSRVRIASLPREGTR